MYITLWMGSRFVKQLHSDLFSSLQEDKRLDLSIVGNITDPFVNCGYKFRNFESLMPNRLISRTDVFIVFDEPWALKFFESDFKIIYFTDISTVPSFDSNTHEMILDAARIMSVDGAKDLIIKEFRINPKSFLNQLGYEVFEQCFSYPIQRYGC